MGTKADFYVGRGTRSEWLGSIHWDAYPDGISGAILTAVTEAEFRQAVQSVFEMRPDVVRPSDGWPWKWDTSHGTNYTYAFDAGQVWICCFGSSWWEAHTEEPEHTTLKSKAAVFPCMTSYRRFEVDVVAEE